MEEFVNILFKIKNTCGSSPIIKLVLIAVSMLSGSVFVMFALSKVFDSALNPYLTIIILACILLIFLGVCAIPPKFSDSKIIVCFMLNMQTNTSNFLHGDSVIIPQIRNILNEYDVKTTLYFKKIFYNIILSPAYGKNRIKNFFEKWFFKRCKAELIIIGNGNIKNNSESVFECFCNILFNPYKENGINKNLQSVFDDNLSFLLSYDSNCTEQRDHAIADLANFLSLVLSYDPSNENVVFSVSKVLDKIQNTNDSVSCQNLDKLIVGMINDISLHHPDIASSKGFIALCDSYLKKFSSVDVFNTKVYYIMKGFLNSNHITIDTLKEFCSSSLEESTKYDCDDIEFLANKAFFNLILDKISEADDLYRKAFELSYDDNKFDCEIFSFLDAFTEHNLIGLQASYAMALYIYYKRSGDDYLNKSAKIFKTVHHQAARNTWLKTFAKKHEQEIKLLKKIETDEKSKLLLSANKLLAK